MKNVDAADLSTGISLADADEVFNGTLSVTEAGWATIELDAPFAYDGTSNLLIGVIKGYCQWFSGTTWYYTAANNMALYSQNDNNAYTTSTTPSGTTNNRPNIQIVITPGSGPVCDKPNDPTISSITENTAFVNWDGGSGSFNVEYKKTSETDWTVAATNVGWNYMLVNLDTSNTHDLKQWLIDHYGILIRDASNFRSLDNHCFRVTARTPEENDLLVEALRKYVSG
jgi:hypothetical protein